MRERILETQLWLPRAPAQIFPFFADAANLDVITPPWLHFCIRSEMPMKMQEGARLEYSIRFRGIPIRWRTNIAAWQPPIMFIDEQLSGPYRLWHHTHTFEAKDGGTLCTDRVRYNHWGGAIFEKLLVRPDLNRIFEYRQERLKAIFTPLFSGALTT